MTVFLPVNKTKYKRNQSPQQAIMQSILKLIFIDDIELFLI